jgi:zinc transport system substrate-binding protein
MTKTLLAIAVGGLVLAGCASTDENASGTESPTGGLQVVASHYPVQFLVEQVGGDMVSLETLTAPGAEPHDLELTPQQVGEVQQAAAVFYIGNFQPAVDEAVAESSGTTVDLTEGLPLLEGEEHAEGDEHAEGEEHGGTDPHVWLDPVLMQQMSTTVADTLAEVDPDNAQTFQDNSARLNEELATLNTEWAQGTANCEIDTLVVSHEAFGYLANQYGFEQRGIAGLTPENEPSAAAIAELAQFVRENAVTTVYTETLVDPAVAETVAAEAGVQTAVLDPLEGPPAEGDYLGAMRDNLVTVKAGQSCS